MISLDHWTETHSNKSSILSGYNIRKKVTFVCTDGVSANKKVFTTSGEMLNMTLNSNDFVIPDDEDSEPLPIDDMEQLNQVVDTFPSICMRCHSHEINNALKKNL